MLLGSSLQLPLPVLVIPLPSDVLLVGIGMGTLTGVCTNGSSECALVHRSTSSSICGLKDAFRATFGTESGTNATSYSYSSTLSTTATPTLDDTVVECFGPTS